jgi:hypothetical protein
MRKPLCNLGKVLTSELNSARVLLQALWKLIAGKISSAVELTHARQEHFELLWPHTAMRQTTCTAKDTIVSMAATITSVLGAVSHLMLDVSLANGHSSANIDARAHARFIMVLTATTNMLSSVLLFPVYGMIVLQKFVTCTATDVSSTIIRLIDAAGNKKQPQLSIKFKDDMNEATEKAGVATCLTEDVRQSLEDAGARLYNVRGGAQNLPEENKIVRIIGDTISNTIDTVLAAQVQYIYHVYDIWIAWSCGVLKGIIDMAQTIDWERCKLPVVDKGMFSLGSCPCNDIPYSVVPEQKQAKWTESAFWCSGLMMLNEGDGSEKIIWNPFSLQELLLLPGAKDTITKNTKNNVVTRIEAEMAHATDFDKYIVCMREHNSKCEYFKPQHPRLTQQGVEVMQVVSRCRENYKQGRWDEASVMYALFTEKEWGDAHSIVLSESARKDFGYPIKKDSCCQRIVVWTTPCVLAYCGMIVTEA